MQIKVVNPFFDPNAKEVLEEETVPDLESGAQVVIERDGRIDDRAATPDAEEPYQLVPVLLFFRQRLTDCAATVATRGFWPTGILPYGSQLLPTPRGAGVLTLLEYRYFSMRGSDEEDVAADEDLKYRRVRDIMSE